MREASSNGVQRSRGPEPLLLWRRMCLQSGEELEHQNRATLQRPYEAVFLRGSGIDESQLSERLVRRAARDQQEAPKVGHRPTATSLRDVGDDGLGGPDQLISTRECTRTT